MPEAWNPAVKIFVVGLVAGAFLGSIMAMLMEYGASV
jgi:hypothetical protein